MAAGPPPSLRQITPGGRPRAPRTPATSPLSTKNPVSSARLRRTPESTNISHALGSGMFGSATPGGITVARASIIGPTAETTTTTLRGMTSRPTAGCSPSTTAAAQRQRARRAR